MAQGQSAEDHPVTEELTRVKEYMQKLKAVVGTALEATQGQMDGFFSQLPYRCHQNRVASVGN